MSQAARTVYAVQLPYHEQPAAVYDNEIAANADRDFPNEAVHDYHERWIVVATPVESSFRGCGVCGHDRDLHVPHDDGATVCIVINCECPDWLDWTPDATPLRALT
jgi:hypothetical protein